MIPEPAPAASRTPDGLGGEKPLLDLRAVTKAWRSDAPPVLEDVDFAAPRGAAVFVGGRNGAGKTTLLRIASGLITPEAGHIELDGMEPRRNRRAYQAAIGFLSAGSSGLYARLSVRQHLDYWSRLAFMAGDARVASMDSAQRAFALDDLRDRRVDRLSMGQRQRLRLAVTFLHDPDLVLLDEPLNSLDEDGAVLLGAAVDGVTARGGAAVICAPVAEHDSPIAYKRGFTLEYGKLRPS